MADKEATETPTVAPTPDNPLEMLTRPALRLSKRQKAILGLCATPAPPTDKQKLRNIAAGERLKKFHEDRRQKRALSEKAATKQLEEKTNVKVIETPKKARVSVKRRLVVESSVESESASESESDEPVVRKKKVHRHEPQAPPAIPAHTNPYFLLLSKRS